MKKLFLSITLLSLLCGGCARWHEEYKKTGWYTPSGFNYTLQRDRVTGDMSDYVGVSWDLK